MITGLKVGLAYMIAGHDVNARGIATGEKAVSQQLIPTATETPFMMARKSVGVLSPLSPALLQWTRRCLTIQWL